MNAWHYYQYLATCPNAEEKKQKKKERHSSVMAARETNTIPARYLGKVGRQVLEEEDENEKPALLYSSTGLLIDGYGRLELNTHCAPLRASVSEMVKVVGRLKGGDGK